MPTPTTGLLKPVLEKNPRTVTDPNLRQRTFGEFTLTFDKRDSVVSAFPRAALNVPTLQKNTNEFRTAQRFLGPVFKARQRQNVTKPAFGAIKTGRKNLQTGLANRPKTRNTNRVAVPVASKTKNSSISARNQLQTTLRGNDFDTQNIDMKQLLPIVGLVLALTTGVI